MSWVIELAEEERKGNVITVVKSRKMMVRSKRKKKRSLLWTLRRINWEIFLLLLYLFPLQRLLFLHLKRDLSLVLLGR